jgi:hypothetical protein
MDFFDLYQQGQIREAQGSAARAANKAEAAADRIADLERRLDRVTLVSQALWELLQADGSFTQDQLMSKMEQVDLRDGRKDGKISMTAKTCPTCHRKSNSRRLNCLYCDAPLPAPNIYEAR